MAEQQTQVPWKRQAPAQQNTDIIREIARDAEKWDAPPQPLRSWEQQKPLVQQQQSQQQQVRPQVAPQQMPQQQYQQQQYQQQRPVQQQSQLNYQQPNYQQQPVQPQQQRPIQQQQRPVSPVQQPVKQGNKVMLRILWGLVVLTTLAFLGTAIYFYVIYVRG